MNRAGTRTLRTFVQLVAAGGLTTLINAIADGLEPYVAGIVAAVNMLVVTFVQNYLESESGPVDPFLENESTS